MPMLSSAKTNAIRIFTSNEEAFGPLFLFMESEVAGYKGYVFALIFFEQNGDMAEANCYHQTQFANHNFLNRLNQI